MRRFIPVLMLLILLAHPAAATTILPLTASATNTSSAFIKYVYSWPLAAGTHGFTGLSGSLSITSARDFFGEALVSVGYYPTGTMCPPSGISFSTYEELAAAYPGSGLLAHYILKQSRSGTVSIPTNVSLPVAVGISGCVVVVLDGSNLSGGKFTMASKMAMTVGDAAPSNPQLLSVDDEFCFGQNWGCQIATTSLTADTVFASVRMAPAGMVRAVYGNLSDGALTYAPKITGNWGMSNEVFVDGGCAHFSPGLWGPGQYSRPADAVSLFSSALSGSGLTSLQQQVNDGSGGQVIGAGDCIVHLVHPTVANGTIDAEMQLMLEVDDGSVPVVTATTTAQPSATATPVSPTATRTGLPTATRTPVPTATKGGRCIPYLTC